MDMSNLLFCISLVESNELIMERFTLIYSHPSKREAPLTLHIIQRRGNPATSVPIELKANPATANVQIISLFLYRFLSTPVCVRSWSISEMG